MAALIYIARTLHYSLCGHLATVVHCGVKYELTRTTKQYWQSTRYLVRHGQVINGFYCPDNGLLLLFFLRPTGTSFPGA